MIYLDNCAATKTCDEAAKAALEAMTLDFANPSSLHSFGLEIEKKIDRARENVARLVNANKEDIYFNSGGTEANNIALHGLIQKNKRKGKEIITSSIEHASILDQLKHYKNLDYKVIFLPVDEFGHVKIEELEKAINKNTILVSLMHVNNEIGTINDLEKICRIVKSKDKDILIHGDGVQAVGKIPVDLKRLDLDTYSFSSHKIYGPKGAGALYKKRGLILEPLVIGGGQEKNLRSGTENVPGILGFGEAAKIYREKFDERYAHARDLKKYLIEKVSENIKDFKINSPDDSSPYILSLSFKNIRAEVLLHYLEGDEIYISTASACSSNGSHKSETLKAIGLDDNLAEGTIRICSSKDISFEDLDIFIVKLKKYIDEIRNIMVGD